MRTLTEENYLKAIFHLSRPRTDTGAVSTNAIADHLGINAASVTDMFKKLNDRRLVVYAKSKGVKLTTEGRKVALEIVRKHRLWETFLVEKLNFSWHEVHEVAEQLEHIQSPLLVERLDKLLDHPRFDPHGDPIPDRHGKIPAIRAIALSDATVGAEYALCGVDNKTDTFLRYLNKVGLSLGQRVRVQEREEFDGSLIIRVANRRDISLSREAADNLFVTG